MKDSTKEDINSSVTMTTKRGLITDSFKVVKKARNGVKREKRPPTPPPQKEPESEMAHEEELQRLRQFDLDWRFGPCTGISRQQRWERAKRHGLSPPEEVRDLLLQTHTGPDYNLSLWSEYPL
ncbi:DNA polymerase delta subunit 4 isoform X2 [Cyclopterus lumpus]|uniref:DNA polymerase delta subunit 4 isoform X2 n=1 Tax=Cyclopterus lumpus TaxID=8103 RepID=UPI0014870893|nr:DNA polymerase delta subunit 4 isoform X2 [Cyclopterus lumpus]XP_034400273.1 DNA polymerase delta subunit 4 isoform X2 [Cyclopterus lumpus]